MYEKVLLLQPAISDLRVLESDEKNDKLKIIIRNKIDEYLGRAEKLKEYLSKSEEPRSRSAMGANGSGTGGVGGKTKGSGGDEGDDAELKKLRAGLTSKVLTWLNAAHRSHHSPSLLVSIL